MKEIKVSKKAYDRLESARLYAQVDKGKDITKGQMIEYLADRYIWGND